MKKIVIVLVIVSCILKLDAQQNINDYKYVIVEKQFHFQSEPNQYDLNELTRFLFKKHGFEAILESDIYPDDLKSNFCLALQSEIVAKGFLKTTVTISLKDCNNNVIFQAEGSTKEKDFSKLYSYAIRDAFEKFNKLKYSYMPKEEIVNNPKTANVDQSLKKNSDEVEKLKAEIEELKKDKEEKATKLEDRTTKELKKIPEPIKVVEPKPSKANEAYFKAQATHNGYNLVNSVTNKVVYTLTKTGLDNVFILNGDNGIMYKKDGKWMIEYVKESTTVVEMLDIVFQ